MKIACAEVTPPPAPAMSVEKRVSGFIGNPSAAAVGDIITYTIEVCNTGNTDLLNVAITDPGANTISGANPGSLVPGQCSTALARHTVTAADLTAGSVTNTASATATDPTGTPVNGSSSVTQPLDPEEPAVTINKQLVSSTVPPLTVGQVVAYEFIVTNTGDVPLSAVSVTDPLVTNITGTPIATLGVGASQTLNGSVVLTQAMVTGANGSRVLNNTGTVSGTSPSGANVTANDTNSAAVNDVVVCYEVCPSCTSQPHAGEELQGNPMFIDYADGYYYFVDCDGSISLYNFLGNLALNPTWTTFTGGGPLNGKTVTQALAEKNAQSPNARLIGVENALFMVMEADGTLGFYDTNGLFWAGSAAYTSTTLGGGGPLAGQTLQNLVNGSVSPWIYLGDHNQRNVFYNTATGQLASYFDTNGFLYDAAWSLGGVPNPSLINGPFQGTLMAAMNSGNFIGVTDGFIAFADPANNNIATYALSNGVMTYNGAGTVMNPLCEEWTCTNGTCVRTDTPAANQTEAQIITAGGVVVPCP
jgi:uncharacterized repeat protein (TIGR01451 family)